MQQSRTAWWAGWGALGLCAALGACDVSAECLPWFQGPACLLRDLGRECSSNVATVRKVTVKPNTADLVRDPGFENCDEFYCASTNGSRPYCTKRCDTQLDCDPGGLPCIPGQPCNRNNWRCETLIEFGDLACATTNEDGTCELDEESGRVKNPAKYCRAVDGTLPAGEYNDPNNQAVVTDGGR